MSWYATNRSPKVMEIVPCRLHATIDRHTSECTTDLQSPANNNGIQDKSLQCHRKLTLFRSVR